MSKKNDAPFEAFAYLKYSGITPRKARRIVSLIRGRNVDEALAILRFSPHSAARVLYKLVSSARVNYANLLGSEDRLVISLAHVDEGKTHKRWRRRARGTMYPVLKRGSHITVAVSKKVR